MQLFTIFNSSAMVDHINILSYFPQQHFENDWVTYNCTWYCSCTKMFNENLREWISRIPQDLIRNQVLFKDRYWIQGLFKTSTN